MSMTLDKIAEWLGGQRQENRTGDQRLTTVVATATGESENGKVKVILSGDVITVEDNEGNPTGGVEVEIPTSEKVRKGDEVILTLYGGALTRPLYTNVQGAGDRTHKAISLVNEAAEEAERIAGEAQTAIDLTNQHFYSDTNGIHVTTEESDDTTGPNMLANSQGIFLRIADKIRTAMLQSGFAVYDGIANTVDNIVALFGSVIRLGKNGDTQLILDNTGMEVVDADICFKAGAVENTSGTRRPMVLLGTPAILNNDIGMYSVAMGLDPEASGLASTAFGQNTKANNTGAFAAGINAEAKGEASVSMGEGTYTDLLGQVALGLYNTKNSENMFAVGNGSSDSNRSDLIAIKYDGTMKTQAGDVLAATVLFSGSSNLQTPITLSDDITNYKRIDIHFADTDLNFGSVSIWSPSVGQYFTCSTSNVYAGGAGISVKTLTGRFRGSSSITMRSTLVSGVSQGWNGQFVKDATQNTVQQGDYITIRKIIGYR